MLNTSSTHHNSRTRLIESDNMDTQYDTNGSADLTDPLLTSVGDSSGISTEPIELESPIVPNDDTDSILLRKLHLHRQSMPWHRRPTLYMLCFLNSIIAISQMIILMPFVQLVMQKVCDGLPEKPEKCNGVEVQTVMSNISSWTMIVSGLVSTFTSGRWGKWSDKHGRLFTLKYIGILRLFSILMQLFVISPLCNFHKWLIIFAPIFEALSGGMFSMVATSNSFIADITPATERSTSISILMSVVSGSIGTGPLIGSFLATINPFYPVYAALCLNILFIILCTFVVHEPRHPDLLEATKNDILLQNSDSSSFSITQNNVPLIRQFPEFIKNQFLETFVPLKKLLTQKTIELHYQSTNKPKTHFSVVILTILDAIFICCSQASISPLILFATYKYNWKATQLGYFISLLGFGKTIALMTIIPFLMKVLKRNYTVHSDRVDDVDRVSLRISFFLMAFAICFLLYFNNYEIAILIFGFIEALSAFAPAALQASIIKYFDLKNAGEIYGALALLRGLVMLVFPPILLHIYGATVQSIPMLFFCVPAAFSVIALIMTFICL